jgi:hypothetical protein
MLEKEFIPYKQAIALKELGFDEPCLKFYANGKLVLGLDTDNVDANNKPSQYNQLFVSAPTYSQTFRWFREKHKIFPYTYTGNGNLFHYCMFIKYKDNQYHSNDLYLSNEEAELECLKKIIELCKKH